MKNNSNKVVLNFLKTNLSHEVLACQLHLNIKRQHNPQIICSASK